MKGRRAATLVLALWGVALLASGAAAHALVRSSSPASGQILQTAPAQVVVTFTEPPDPKLSFLQVLDSAGQSVASGVSGPVPGNPLQLRIALKPLPKGVYTVVWRTVSQVDGHVTGNSFSFGVGVSSVPASGSTSVSTSTTPSPKPLMVAGRWMFYWGLAILLGGSLVIPVVLRGPPSGWRVLLIGGLAAAALGLGAMVLSEKQTVGVSFGALFSSATGAQYRDRLIAIVLVAIAAAFVLTRVRTWSIALLGAATAGAMLVHARGGHAAVSGSLSWFNVTVQWFHLLAVGIWIGGLAWLLLGLARIEGEERRRLGTRFANVAAIALAVVALTGLSRALDQVGWPDHWGRLFDTSFGITVVIKVVLFCGLVALGAANHYRNVPAVASGRKDPAVLRRSVKAEVAVAAVIFAVTGVMTSLPPAASLAATSRPSPPQNLSLTGHDFATTTQVRLTVTPGTVGPNTFLADVRDYDSHAPVTASSVTLTFSLPGRPDLGTQSVPLRRTSGASWSGQGLALSSYGRWNVTVVVQESANAVEVPLELTPRLPPEKITAAAAPGQPTLYTISLTGSDSLQTYVDPGAAGTNAVHFTYFTPSGSEETIRNIRGSAVAPSSGVQSMTFHRFDPGHFAANMKLSAGQWTFLVQATTSSGKVLSAYFSPTIGS